MSNNVEKLSNFAATDTIVLAFSGGLDTSWCVPWLKKNTGARVVTVTVDVGGFTPLEQVQLETQSKDLGAERHICVDAKQLFFDEVVRYLLMGNVLRGQVYPICVGAERTLQAREVGFVARKLGAVAVAHGCTAAGNDQVRFEVALRALLPELDILAPIRDQAPSRQEEIDDLTREGFAVPAHGGDYSVNSGLWGLTIGGLETTTSATTLPERAWVRTAGAFDSPPKPQLHTISFEGGVPTALDGAFLPPVALIEKLDSLASGFGIGRGIHVGDTILGIKGRVAFEAPAAAVLIPAHRELEKLTLTAAQMSIKDSLAHTYGDLVHGGQFLEPACRDIESLMENSQQRVTGDVHVRLLPRCAFVEGVDSPHSLLDASRAVYGESAGEWDPADAAGFSRLRSLPIALHQRARNSSTISTENFSEIHHPRQDRLGHPQLSPVTGGQARG